MRLSFLLPLPHPNAGAWLRSDILLLPSHLLNPTSRDGDDNSSDSVSSSSNHGHECAGTNPAVFVKILDCLGVISYRKEDSSALNTRRISRQARHLNLPQDPHLSLHPALRRSLWRCSDSSDAICRRVTGRPCFGSSCCHESSSCWCGLPGLVTLSAGRGQ